MRYVPIKTVEQLDLQALHRIRARLISQRTGTINQIRAFLLERGIAVRQGLRFLRQVLPEMLAKRTDVLTPRMIRLIEELAGDWHWLDDRIGNVTEQIEALVREDAACQRLMSVPGIGPIIASAMVATIGDGSAFRRGRDFAALAGLVPRQLSTATERSSVASPSEGITICGCCSCRRRGSCCSGRQTGPSTALGRGCRQR
jgi:transposase